MSRTVFAGLLLAVALLALPAAASAATFKVKSTGNAGDSNTGDGVCASSGTNTATCTLRAALEQANIDNFTTDLIQFSGSTVAGQTIAVPAAGPALPLLNGPVTIDGCSSDPDHVGPCVGLRTEAIADDALQVGFNDVKVKGLAITNADRGIAATFASPDGLIVKNNWFGVRLNGAAEEIFVGIALGGDSATVGGDTSVERNVIANSAIYGLHVSGGDDNVIQGNRFGTKPDGSGSMPNAENIDVSGIDLPMDLVPEGTVIGGTVSASRAATAKCDGVCNLILNASGSGPNSGNGIDLAGTEINEVPAGETTIAGNNIGLNRSGTSDKGNASNGVRVGLAEDLTIGGETSAARNYIAGSAGSDVTADEASTVTVKRNYIGLNRAGTAAIPSDFSGIELGNGLVDRNRFGVGGSAALFVRGDNDVDITNNTIGIGTGGQNVGNNVNGIELNSATNVQLGHETGQNTIGNVNTGIWMIGTDESNIRSNFIGRTAGGTAKPIAFDGIDVNAGSSNNGFGGAGPQGPNRIENVGDDAISMSGNGTEANTLSGNFGKTVGTSFSDLFLDIGNGGPGNGQAMTQGGIEAPVITSITVENASTDTYDIVGTGGANHVVQVFLTKSAPGAQPKRVDNFANCCANADGSGDWEMQDVTLPDGFDLTAQQRDALDINYSEFSVVVAYP